MTDVVNLNKFKKAKEKQRKVDKANQNRIVFGLSTKLRKAKRTEGLRDDEKLDGHVIETDAGDKNVDGEQ